MKQAEIEAIKSEPNNRIAYEKGEKLVKESVSDTIKRYKNENKRNFQHRKGIRDEVKNR